MMNFKLTNSETNKAHAPGRSDNYLQCGHNMIKSNARVYHLFKEKYDSKYPGSQVGITLNINYAQSWYPADPEAQAGAQAQLEFSLRSGFHVIHRLQWPENSVFYYSSAFHN